MNATGLKRQAKKTPPMGVTTKVLLGLACAVVGIQLWSLRIASAIFEVHDDIMTTAMWQHIADSSLQQSSQPSGWSDMFKMPPFDTIHDFAQGPRSQRIVVGYTKDDLLNGRGVSFHDKEDGTVHMNTFQSSSRNVPPIDEGTNRTEKFAGMTREQRSGGYSAAWLTTVDGLLKTERISTDHLFTADKINLEYGHIAMSIDNWNLQAVDMFDFFVHHLSYYERVTGKGEELRNDTIKLLEVMQDDYEQNQFYNNPSKQRNGHTLAIVAYFAGDSKGPSQRRSQLFLNMTIKTVASIFPNVAVFVGHPLDYEYVTQHSGLNQYLYDVQLMKDLRSFDHITYGTSVTAKTLFQKGVYSQDDFDFVYYTESDELPHMRNVHYLLRHTLQEPDPRHAKKNAAPVIIPHRGQPFSIPPDVSADTVQRWKKNYDKAYLNGERTIHDVPDLMTSSCCFERPAVKNGPFINPQRAFPISEAKVEFIRQHRSFSHVAGTGNIFKQEFWLCEFSDERKLCLPAE
eukprot:CAMPEP_0198110212 /NCGR_PEP_ID=MMETSP1442-20131203/2230_1 /TAXON_ID= /ORGANISM="Craspedostauros australis, Strain CCMP3328" /LENGTH=513 /DNA_ID=CAMNT_0043766169 /DNA_START=81 /DNA_END=1622 /DNA_ORIENTATION=+